MKQQTTNRRELRTENMKRFHSNHAQRSIKSKRSTLHHLHLFQCLHLNVSLLFLILFHATILQSVFDVFVDSFQLNVVSPRTFRNKNSVSTSTRTILPFTVKNDSSSRQSILEYQRYFNNNKNDLIRLYSSPTTHSNNEEILSPNKETKDNNDNNNTKKNKRKKSSSTQRNETTTSKNVLDVKEIKPASDLKQTRTQRTWDDSYELLKQYKEQHGDCLVPQRYDQDKKLGLWVYTQRRHAKKGILKTERKEKLNKIGFSWEARTENWNFMFEELKEFQQEFGHCNVEIDKYKSRQTLAIWVKTQRQFKGLLTNEQQSQLDELGFVWEDVGKARGDCQWEERFEALLDYQRIHGDTRVPQRASHNNVKLGQWVHRQRKKYQKRILQKDREDKLNSIGFIWKLKDQNVTNYKRINKIWMKNLEKLKDFKKTHDHTNVPYRYEEDPKLGLWVFNQRKSYRLGTLKKIRQEMLESIGFEWNPQEKAYEEQWMDQYQDLVVFQNKHGHVDVPRSSNPNLYHWLSYQRTYFANNKLESERKELLEKLGVDLNNGPGSGNIMEN